MSLGFTEEAVPLSLKPLTLIFTEVSTSYLG